MRSMVLFLLSLLILHEYDVYVLLRFISCMLPFSLCRAEPGIQRLLDKWLGSVQIWMTTYLVSAR